MNQFIHGIFYDEHGKLRRCAYYQRMLFRCVAPFTLCGITFRAGVIWECDRDYLRFCCNDGIIKLETQQRPGARQCIEIDYKIFSECFEWRD